MQPALTYVSKPRGYESRCGWVQLTSGAVPGSAVTGTPVSFTPIAEVCSASPAQTLTFNGVSGGSSGRGGAGGGGRVRSGFVRYPHRSVGCADSVVLNPPHTCHRRHARFCKTLITPCPSATLTVPPCLLSVCQRACVPTARCRYHCGHVRHVSGWLLHQHHPRVQQCTVRVRM